MKSIGFSYSDNIEIIENKNINSINLPNNLDSLRACVENCYLCELSKSRKNTVFGEGNINANIMFLGEFPSATEDEMSRPFVGRAGEVLTNMIQNVLKIKREDVYISNIVKCKPSNNKAPSVQESHSCRPYLFKQIELINPKLIVALGEGAYKYLTNEEVSISKIRGQIQNYKKSQLLLTYHPSFLLRNPTLKKDAYYDMLKIKDFMEL
jgi:DNA polymerase